MKKEQEVAKCDQCGNESTFTKGTYGGSYFPGWISIKQNHTGGVGVYSTDQPLTGGKDFCCIECAVKFLISLLKEDDIVVLE